MIASGRTCSQETILFSTRVTSSTLLLETSIFDFRMPRLSYPRGNEPQGPPDPSEILRALLALDATLWPRPGSLSTELPCRAQSWPGWNCAALPTFPDRWLKDPAQSAPAWPPGCDNFHLNPA